MNLQHYVIVVNILLLYIREKDYCIKNPNIVLHDFATCSKLYLNIF